VVTAHAPQRARTVPRAQSLEPRAQRQSPEPSAKSQSPEPASKFRYNTAASSTYRAGARGRAVEESSNMRFATRPLAL